MKVRSKRELETALARIELDVRSCGIKAMPTHAIGVLRMARALRFALGYSERENERADKELRMQSPYFISKHLKLLTAPLKKK